MSKATTILDGWKISIAVEIPFRETFVFSATAGILW